MLLSYHILPAAKLTLQGLVETHPTATTDLPISFLENDAAFLAGIIPQALCGLKQLILNCVSDSL